MTTVTPAEREPGPSIDVGTGGEIFVVLGGSRAEVADPYAFHRSLRAAIDRRIDIRAVEHLGPIAGWDD
jgi:hypothetical protein